MLKEHFHIVYENIKPINLIKITFNEIAASQGIKDNILNTAVGLTAGYLFKMIFVRVSKCPIKKLLGATLLFGITNVVAKNPEALKSQGKGFSKIISSNLCDRIQEAGTYQNETRKTTS